MSSCAHSYFLQCDRSTASVLHGNREIIAFLPPDGRSAIRDHAAPRPTPHRATARTARCRTRDISLHRCGQSTYHPESRRVWSLTGFQTLLWSWAFFEGSVLLALSGYCPPALAHPLLKFLLPAFLLPATLTSSDPTFLTALTPAFLAGTLLILAGGLLRARCYHALGSRFTFELCIRPAHALVTDGVYGVVRHPGYTGGFGLVIGWLLCVLDQRGCVLSAFTGLDPSQASAPGGDGSGHAVVTGAVWVTTLGLLCVAISKRMDKEDAMLEKNFGEEWRAWAKKVPCRLVPGVY